MLDSRIRHNMGSNISQASLPWNPDSQERPEKPIIAFFFFVLGEAPFQIQSRICGLI